jgi:TnpA family transposase
LADATNLGLTRMAAASQGVTRDQLIWTAAAYIRPETYKAALAKIINAHHALPIAAIWGDGTTSSSDGQFFRSGKRGDTAGEVNARYGVDPGLSFYTHVSDQHGPYNIKVMSATNHEAPYVLDGQELGRIERTLFMLDWLESPELRQRCHAGLNKSEQRHALAQVGCTAAPSSRAELPTAAPKPSSSGPRG